VAATDLADPHHLDREVRGGAARPRDREEDDHQRQQHDRDDDGEAKGPSRPQAAGAPLISDPIAPGEPRTVAMPVIVPPAKKAPSRAI
jgi:hypothetical protein